MLLNHNLLKSKQDDAVAILARARTLVALQGLDVERKGHLLTFLYEARLIGFVDDSDSVGELLCVSSQVRSGSYPAHGRELHLMTLLMTFS